ncbi:MAG: cytochrome c-type biogenesis protein CcmH [Lysobacteraceae bacterium]|nr:MAG: cytochrome c-type biogenesis protein CcmH [Xanthomonadaceae bacterium]
MNPLVVTVRVRRRDASNVASALIFALTIILALSITSVSAQQSDSAAAPLRFENAAEERRFHALTSELRCVMCQNQSLADSNAQIAHDLRREVLDLMRAGRSDEEIRDFLVERYGDFVLYRPRVNAETLLLWIGPLLLALGGGVALTRIVRRRNTEAVKLADSPDPHDHDI